MNINAYELKINKIIYKCHYNYMFNLLKSILVKYIQNKLKI